MNSVYGGVHCHGILKQWVMERDGWVVLRYQGGAREGIHVRDLVGCTLSTRGSTYSQLVAFKWRSRSAAPRWSCAAASEPTEDDDGVGGRQKLLMCNPLLRHVRVGVMETRSAGHLWAL
ncbi:hypothetical protein E2562_008607 [Oryza meyeriana var. granulata]|uniref:Uncharacterized protein n=1 Tax=Oryza meyeriana var. granulata TaxID=110450 RepID=A0A6G1C5P7_9ORYZ|nr:hypothetical protein E2562_008607 [Oryza meyeriana var. granulata]